MGRLTDTELAEWVGASCERHGVPVKVTDAVVVANVAALLSEGRARKEAKRRRPPGSSETPHGINSSRIEASASGVAWSDHGVVEHGSDDGVLSGQVQSRPLSA